MIAIGTEAFHVERILMGKPRLILRTKVARETRTQWVDDRGDRWEKTRIRSAIGRLRRSHRYLMTEAEFTTAGGVL